MHGYTISYHMIALTNKFDFFTAPRAAEIVGYDILCMYIQLDTSRRS